MGQRGSSTGSRSDRRGGCKAMHGSSHHNRNNNSHRGALPATPADMTPAPLSTSDAAALRDSWLSAAEAALAHEWRAGRARQKSGVAATSPRVPLTCGAAAFPGGRSTGVVQRPAEEPLAPREIPVGREFYLALRAAWRGDAGGGRGGRKVPPATDRSRLNDSFILQAIEEPVGAVMSPPVPLEYMVSEILVPQWEVDGMFDTPTVRQKT